MKFLIWEDEIVNLKDLKSICFLQNKIFVEFYEFDFDWEIDINMERNSEYLQCFKEFLRNNHYSDFDFTSLELK